MPGFLSELSPDKEKKQFGFTVYDAETGMPMPYQDNYFFDAEGILYWCDDTGSEAVDLAKTGKHIIFFSDCSWMRY